jgi:hypothetical protein
VADNYITVNLRCSAITKNPLVSILVDLDKVGDADNVNIEVSREDLATLGEYATWYQA